MEKSLFEQAKEMMTNLMNSTQSQQGGHNPNASDKEAVRKVIKSAYQNASPEEKAQLDQFEQQLDEKIQLH
ncbi:DUF3813 family protein [Pseudogracilibacillus sp. SE30717A]|uniref:DUF3813 domain-containing protein n=1 Tax=Pseudogracilibacillus sp. SE30717A TaxID=3098293 RepID=UPI00300E6337